MSLPSLNKIFKWGLFILLLSIASQVHDSGNIAFGSAHKVSVQCGEKKAAILITAQNKFSGGYIGSSFFLDSISVSHIPANCSGKVFSISAIGKGANMPLYLSGDCFFSTTEAETAGQRVDVYFDGNRKFDPLKTTSTSIRPPSRPYSWRFAGTSPSQAGVAAQLLDSYAYPVAVTSDSFTISWITNNDPATFCNGTNYLKRYFSVPLASEIKEIKIEVHPLMQKTQMQLTADGII